MGRWAQSRRRGGGGVLTSSVAAPVLTALGDPDLSWTWSGPDPDAWSIENSALEAGPFLPFDTAPGVDRDYHAAVAGTWFRIIGMDVTPAPVTDYSNKVLQT